MKCTLELDGDEEDCSCVTRRDIDGILLKAAQNQTQSVGQSFWNSLLFMFVVKLVMAVLTSLQDLIACQWKEFRGLILEALCLLHITVPATRCLHVQWKLSKPALIGTEEIFHFRHTDGL